MSDLAGFLLARIAEDAAEAQSAIDQRNREVERGVYLPGHLPQPDTQGPMVWDDWTGGPGIRFGAERVLAECAAKRAAVEATTYYARYLAEVDLEHDILRALSSVYSAHADFRPEWRS